MQPTFRIIWLLFCLLVSISLYAEPVNLISWNLHNFGKAKLAKSEVMEYLAEKIRFSDLVAIQEVSTGPHGAKAVAHLADLLNRKGAKWNYFISDPTTGSGSERYAFLVKPSKIKVIGKPWLETKLADEISREPFLIRFRIDDLSRNDCNDNRCILLTTFHAVPTKKKPESEIRALSLLTTEYPDDAMIISGDFNLRASHNAFETLLEQGLAPCLINQKTTLKRKIKQGQHLANEYDNILIRQDKLSSEQCRANDFSEDFDTLKEALKISDHLPVSVDIDFPDEGE